MGWLGRLVVDCNLAEMEARLGAMCQNSVGDMVYDAERLEGVGASDK